jgi:hypothetical protein
MSELGMFLLPVAPLLLLLVSLLFGFYPGCDAMMRLADRIASGSRARFTALDRPSRPHPPARRAAHGGLLLAFSLSGRAPPA